MKKSRRQKPPPPEPKVTDDRPLSHRALSGLESIKKALESESERSAAETAKAEAERASRAAAYAKTKADAAARAKTEVWRPDLDRDLLRIAMSGVVPLDKGKAVPRTPGAASHGSGRGRDVGAAMRRARAEGGDSIPVRWNPDGTFEAARPGRSFALEALERFGSVEHRLDLHGLDAVEAASRVGEFVRTRRARGARVIAIVHGAGKHSPDGTSVLRDVVVRTLSTAPVCRDVDAFRSTEAAGPSGPGATLVALRQG